MSYTKTNWQDYPANTGVTAARMNNIENGVFNAIGICTSSTRPSSPFEGQRIYETDTDKMYRWTGSAWVLTAGGVIPTCIVSTTSQSVNNNTYTVVNFGSTAAVNTDTMHSTSVNPNRITAQTAGIYLVRANGYPQAVAVNGITLMEMRKNGSVYEFFQNAASASANGTIGGHALIPLAVGDYVDIRVLHTDSGAGARTWFASLHVVWVGPPA